ncbi:polymorphic transmembrane cluster 2 transmembrane protein 2 [Biomphalaria pfeifferi]|uniref:Polymorphic transmembrane cluster 2 transmembrane protein 2 n=1 Tax=Biomphalaria pfeifferi TaxID=112525 RepID=A0AAD8C644_BIOPF|nr:polymorphic transmembrane cluster 2 transmembrane protein 2 [Biomphalaria pfeifferi]
MHRTAVILIIYFISVSAERANAKESIACSPTLEGSELIVNATWNNTVNMSIKHKDVIVLICERKKDCQPINKFPFELENPVKIMDSISSLTLKVETATRKGSQPTGDEWSLHYFGKGEMVTTHCLVVAMSDIQCESNTTTSGLGIHCFASEVFPQALCEISVNAEGVTQFITQDLIMHTHHNTSSEPVYYNTSCSYVIPSKEVTASTITVDVYMYPNVIGPESAQKFRKHSRISFDLAVSTSCLPAHEGGTSQMKISFSKTASVQISRDDGYINVLCEANQICTVSDALGFVQNITEITLNSRTSLAISVTNVTRHISESLSNSWTVTVTGVSGPLKQSCRIYELSKEIACQYSPLLDSIKMSCNAPRMFPAGKCRFQATFGTGKAVETQHIKYSKSQVSINPDYYNMTCSAQVSWNLINQQTPSILVSVYPDLFGTERDVIYGTDRTETINMEVPPVELDFCPPSVERGTQNIVCQCRSSSNDTQAIWSSSFNEHAIESNTLTFNATSFTVFYCHGKNSLGRLGLPKIYKPKITYPPTIVKGDEITTNESVYDVSSYYIKCKATEVSGAGVKLVKRIKIWGWSREEHTAQTQKNKVICPDSVFYDCVESDSESVETDVLKCKKVETSSDSSSAVALAVCLSVVFIAIIIVAIVIIWKVKPSFLHLPSLKARKDTCYDDPGEYTYPSGKDIDNTYLTPAVDQKLFQTPKPILRPPKDDFYTTVSDESAI